MSVRKYQISNQNGDDMTQELISFANAIGLERACPGRYSMLLVLSLFGSAKSGFLNPGKVVSQIRAMEGLDKGQGLKAATLFRHPPLKGLWHQHYLEDGISSIARNLKRGLSKYGLPYVHGQIAESARTGVDKYITAEDVKKIADDVVSGNWDRLVNAQALTGEWIIFAKHNGENYYLSIGKHQSGDDVLRSQIDAICTHEFPFLNEILD